MHGPERAAFLEKFLTDDSVVKHYDTETNNATVVAGQAVYSPERKAQHDEIINGFIQDAVIRGVPADRKALMSGGMGGSGKGTILFGSKKSGIPALTNEDQWLTIDPDKVKEKMLEMGMGPGVPGLQPMEQAGFIHEESSHISKVLTARVAELGLNAILDTTMASEGSTRKRAQMMQDFGYDLEAVFADVPLDVTKASAIGRWENAAKVYAATGKGLGGRYVPAKYLEGSTPTPGSGYLSRNREALEALRKEGLFSRVRVFDNSDRSKPPVLQYDTSTQSAPIAKTG